jgi:hypothetical protein
VKIGGEGGMPNLYTIHCPAIPDHRMGWTPIPALDQSLPLMAAGRPGKNPDLVKRLQRCPSCVVRFVMKP